MEDLKARYYHIAKRIINVLILIFFFYKKMNIKVKRRKIKSNL